VAHILASDIGGTGSRFAHFLSDGRELTLLATTRLSTADYRDGRELFEDLASGDFSLAPSEADMVVLAVAGFVSKDMKARITSRGWEIDGAALASMISGEVLVINDLVAQAWATRSPLAAAMRTVLPGTSRPDSIEAVIASGTGLGKAFIVPEGRGGLLVLPSEGGHGAFPVASAEELDFVRFLCDRVGERGKEADFIVSGRGLPHLQAYLYGEELDERQVVAALERSPRTVEWMARFLGRVCRDTALDTLALGGVTLAGGVVGRFPAFADHRAFRESFRHSATMADLLASIPVRLLADEASGLWGAARAGMERLKEGA
jgi:glucokinase